MKKFEGFGKNIEGSEKNVTDAHDQAKKKSGQKPQILENQEFWIPGDQITIEKSMVVKKVLKLFWGSFEYQVSGLLCESNQVVKTYLPSFF